MKLYLLRHAESEGNATDDYSTAVHDALTSLGRMQAARLAEHLAGIKFDAVYTSPARRAMETIAPFLRRHGKKSEIWPELDEACWQTQRDAVAPTRARKGPACEIPTDMRSLFALRTDAPDMAPPDETYAEGLARARAAHGLIMRRHAGRPDIILVSGHRYCGSLLLEMTLGFDPLRRFDHDNACHSLAEEQDDGTFLLKFLNRQ